MKIANSLQLMIEDNLQKSPEPHSLNIVENAEKHNQEFHRALGDNPIPTSIAEDGHLRSIYVRRLLQEVDICIHQNTSPLPPRVLVQFWDDEKAIPTDVRECIDSWQPLEEQGFERLLFDDDSARQFIVDNFGPRYLTAFELCHHPAMRSDYFRLCFIMSKGGFYVDADDVYQGGNYEMWFNDNRLKLQPLCYDISTDLMVNTSDFLLNPPDLPNLIFYFNNNPLIAPPGHPVIHIALERSTQTLLARADDLRDIQSITGPGNLTASVVTHAIDSMHAGRIRDFVILTDWDAVAVSRWSLQYRSDERNWRLWRGRNV